MAELQQSVTDVDIEQITIYSANFSNGYDLTPHLEELSIYENIFDKTLKATLILVDAWDLPNKLPILGEERIKITIHTPTAKDVNEASIDPKYFHVTRIHDRDYRSPQSQRFILELVSEQYMNNISSRVSKSYTDKSASEIVQDIYNNHLNDGNFLTGESTKNETCVIPNWSPFQAINFLCRRTISEESSTSGRVTSGNAVNFLYFQTMKDTFFKSLHRLMSLDPVLTFITAPRDQDIHKIESLADLSLVKADSIKIMNQFKRIENINHGQYASKLLTHDIVTKKLRMYHYDGYNQWFWINHCGAYPPYNNAEQEFQASKTNVSLGPFAKGFQFQFDPSDTRTSSLYDSDISFYPKHKDLFANRSPKLFGPSQLQVPEEARINKAIPYDNRVEDWKLQRAQHMQQMNGVVVQVECGGKSFIRLGTVVKVIIRAAQAYEVLEDPIDQILTGRFLITKIRHVITLNKGNAEYKMVLEMRKDGLEKPAPDVGHLKKLTGFRGQGL